MQIRKKSSLSPFSQEDIACSKENNMKVYLASWFASKDDIKKRAERLEANGIEVTSRWLDEQIKGTTNISEVSDNYLRETAKVDIEDILLANILVLNVPSAEEISTIDIPIASWARGGRHFETGFFYATMVFFNQISKYLTNKAPRMLILVGHRENVFHYLDGLNSPRADNYYLPTIELFETWELAEKFLVYTNTNEVNSIKSR